MSIISLTVMFRYIIPGNIISYKGIISINSKRKKNNDLSCIPTSALLEPDIDR